MNNTNKKINTQSKHVYQKIRILFEENILWPWLAAKNKQFPSVNEKIQFIEPIELYFGKQDIETVSFLKEKVNIVNTINIKDFRFYRFLTGDEQYYRAYYGKLYQNQTEQERESLIDKNISRLNQIVDDIRQKGITSPIEYFIRDDGIKIIADGNKRASIAYFYGMSVSAKEISIKEFIYRNLIHNKSKNGIISDALPYSSFFYKGKESIYGKRRDVFERINAIDVNDLKNNKILDLGSNYGASSFAAVEKGSKLVYGIEKKRNIISTAVKNNIAFNYPCRFVHADLSQRVELGKKFETGFCFSIDRWVRNNSILAENIANHVTEVLYFETHVEANIPEEIKRLAKSIEFRGKTDHKRRSLYKLVLNL